MALPVTYKYDVYRNGVYLGILPKVSSPFAYTQDINTPGAQLIVTTAQDIDTQQQPVTLLTDESSNQLTDESGNPLTTDRAPDIYGNLNNSAMIRNGNEIKVWEYTPWQPNGKLVFDGIVKRWNAHIGVSDAVDLTVLSYGSELDSRLVFGSLSIDQAATTPDTNASSNNGVAGTSGQVAQVFTTGANVNNISGVSFMMGGILGSATVTAHLYIYTGGNPNSGTLLASTSAIVLPQGSNVAGSLPALTTANFSSPVTISPYTTYAITFTVGSGNAFWMYATNTYTGGSSWVFNGTSWASSSTPFVFITYATNSVANGFTNSIYFNTDPAAMANDFMGNYVGAGGKVGIGNIASSGAVLTRSFILNTLLEGINDCLNSLPSGYYWYVDVGSSLLYLQPKSTTPDHIFTFKIHINQFELLVTSEATKNNVYLMAGNTVSGQPISVFASDQSSAANFGVGLDRITDSRIIDAGSAQIVVGNYVAVNSGEQYQSQITIFASNYDLTTLSLGQVIGFNGFESYADTLRMMIVRIDRHSEFAILDLGTIPKRASTKAERLERALLSVQTINNPLSAI